MYVLFEFSTLPIAHTMFNRVKEGVLKILLKDAFGSHHERSLDVSTSTSPTMCSVSAMVSPTFSSRLFSEIFVPKWSANDCTELPVNHLYHLSSR